MALGDRTDDTEMAGGPRGRIDLNGAWQFRLDPEDGGEQDGWQRGAVSFTDEIAVPGAWQAQGFGAPHGILRHDYSGVAWYRRTVPVPADWDGKHVTLRIGGAHRRTRAFVNGRPVGDHDGFSAPFAFDIAGAIRPGAENVVVLRIENPPNPIEDSPDKQHGGLPTGMLNYLGNWGGIYGDVALEAAAKTRIASVYVRTDAATGVVRFAVEAAGDAAQVRVAVEDVAPVEAAVFGGVAEASVTVPDARLWSPENPHLYTATIGLFANGVEVDRTRLRFGIRTIEAQGDVLLLNGKPLYLRGYGDDNVEVLTGFPSASKEVHKARLKRAKAYGFNAVRWHSMTPPEAYFEAADEVGMLVMAELPAAYTQYFANHYEFQRCEMRAVLAAHRNHPSLLSLALGNEFDLRWLKSDEERTTFVAALGEFYHEAKSIAPDTLIMSNDGFDLRPSEMLSLFGDAPGDVPVVRHEFGEYYCSLPDIAQIALYDGVMDPAWLRAKKAWVDASGLAEEYPTYVRNSQRLQHLGQKFQIERVRRDGRISGYHYWLIVDFPGGTGEGDSWEEGWLDSFWNPKTAAPSDGRPLNCPVLSLIDAGPGDRVHGMEESRTVRLTVSNYGDKDIVNAPIGWRLLGGRQQNVDNGWLTASVPMGKVADVAEIVFRPQRPGKAEKRELVVMTLVGSRFYMNRWSFWAFPRLTPMSEPPMPVTASADLPELAARYPFIARAEGAPSSGLLITSALDDAAVAFLQAGGSVWLMRGAADDGAPDRARFFPASGGSQGTIIRDHPALRGFPHEGFCDQQFFGLIEGASYCALDGWPHDLAPIIGGVRTTSSFLSKSKDLSRFGYVFEARVGRGKLLVTSLRLADRLTQDCPAAALLVDNLLRYATGPEFAPAVTVGEAELASLS